MKTIAIVYFSGSGYTALVAEAYAKGLANEKDIKVELHRITGEQIEKGRWKNETILASLKAADAIVFGTPTYMGGVAAQFKAFADGTAEIWYGRGFAGKLAAGFTTSGSPSGDKQGTLIYLNTLANQHGMLWISQTELPSQYLGKTDGVNRLGSFSGVMGQNANPMGAAPVVDAGDARTAELHAQRIAALVRKL
jgi:NAD(P)H dehydrogenase (quinone)